MLRLSSDETFHFELLKLLAHASYGGSDIAECLVAAGEIVPGDFESWYLAWNRRAERVLSQIPTLRNPVSIRDALFRAATYSRAADFYLHGSDWDDPRIAALWKRQTECFDKAIALLSVPGYRALVKADGLDVPVIVFPTTTEAEEGKRRPTIVLGNGYDGSMEELWHMHGAAAAERGYNVVVYEGPGQPSVRRDQGLGFIHNWEAVVSPVLDHLATLPFVDARKIGLLGYSMGGLLAARAAAFDHRVAAVFQIDGLYDFTRTPIFTSDQSLSSRFGDGRDEKDTQALLVNPKVPAGLRWLLGQGLWAFKVRTRAELLERMARFSLVGVAEKIRCPVFVGDAADDMFFKGQPQVMAEVLGERATVVTFTGEDGAGEHCHVGTSRYSSQVMYEWFEEKVVNA